MKKVLVLGAGLSTPSLIKYLLDQSEEHKWKIYVGDISKAIAKKRINGNPNGVAFKFDVFDKKQTETEIKSADLVISMLPANLHYSIAKCCLNYGKNMVTASYVSDEVRAFDKEARKKGVIMLNEMGLDPGIDHMSAMDIIHRIKDEGGKLISFRSSTGGLVAPKYDNNPWNYKFTWNPRNVVRAGNAGAQYINRGKYKYIPYHKLFTRLLPIYIDGYGEFESYPNRDSLQYRSTYGLEDIPTMFRGTIRRPGFSKTWNALVQIGATDDSFIVEDSENMTYREFINSFLKYEPETPVEVKMAKYVGFAEDSIEMYKLRWLGLFENEKIGLKDATPAQILQKRLEGKWSLDPHDKDMIVMQHSFKYELNGETKEIISSLAVLGKNNVHTAMAQTVGIPVGIGAKLILSGKINPTGVGVPTTKEIYKPILEELKEYNIVFKEKESVLR